MSDELQTILIAVLAVLAICLIIAIVMRVTKVIFTIIVLIILVPILCTILWGNGEEYVSKIASVFTPQIETEINEGYQYYREQEQQNPTVDLEQLKEYANSASGKVKDFVGELFPSDEDEEEHGANRVFPPN